MSTSPGEFVAHMRDETEYLLSAQRGLSRERFLSDDTLKRAFVRSVEVISEGARATPPEFRERYPAVEWEALAAITDRLVHGCFGTDHEIIWDFVVSKVPELYRETNRILDAE